MISLLKEKHKEYRKLKSMLHWAVMNIVRKFIIYGIPNPRPREENKIHLPLHTLKKGVHNMIGLACSIIFTPSKTAAPCQLHLGKEDIFGFRS